MAGAPKILAIPIGLDAAGMRQEFDSLGKVEVPANRGFVNLIWIWPVFRDDNEPSWGGSGHP